jgi:hypothetical protein
VPGRLVGEETGMHITSHITRSVQAERSAREILGGRHPLALVVGGIHVVAEQSAVVAALLSASVVAELKGLPGALAFVAAAAVVQAALGCRLALLLLRRHECVRELIVEGRADLPLAAVRRERDALLDPAHRADLARWLDAIAEECAHPGPPLPWTAPLFRTEVVAGASAELADISRLLRGAGARARGIAMLETLLTDGRSPLYGADVGALREELHRIRFILGS